MKLGLYNINVSNNNKITDNMKDMYYIAVVTTNVQYDLNRLSEVFLAEDLGDVIKWAKSQQSEFIGFDVDTYNTEFEDDEITFDPITGEGVFVTEQGGEDRIFIEISKISPYKK